MRSPSFLDLKVHQRWHEPIYDVHAHLLLCDWMRFVRFVNAKHAAEYTDMEPSPPQACSPLFLSAPDNRKDLYFWFKGKTSVPVLAHEGYHATAQILRAIGMFSEEESDEAYCYYQEYWVRELCVRLKKLRLLTL